MSISSLLLLSSSSSSIIFIIVITIGKTEFRPLHDTEYYAFGVRPGRHDCKECLLSNVPPYYAAKTNSIHTMHVKQPGRIQSFWHGRVLFFFFLQKLFKCYRKFSSLSCPSHHSLCIDSGYCVGKVYRYLSSRNGGSVCPIGDFFW